MNFNLSNLSRMKYYWLAGFIALLVLSFVYYRYPLKPGQQNAGIWVEAKKTSRGSIPVEVQAVGTLIAAKQVVITPEVAGHVATILFKDGSFVKKGTALIQLDDAIPRAQLNFAKADFEFSEATYARKAKLGKKGLWPKQEVDQARADLEEKRALLQEKQVIVDKMQLTAPFDGVVSKCQVTPGHYVVAGQPLVSLIDLQSLRAEFSISEKYLSVLKLGQTIKIATAAYPEKVFKGTIAYISPTIDASDRTIALYAEVANPDSLLTAGLSVSVMQTLGQQNNAILVPARSIMATLDGQQVYKIFNHKAYAVPVILGQRNEDTVEILQGLSEKDLIVVAGQQKLHDEVEVLVQEDPLQEAKAVG